MAACSKRRILAVGGSRAVAMPPDWLVASGLDVGDKIELIYDSVVVVKPVGMKVDPKLIAKELALLGSAKE
jgi:antitoxin component of MazEF toxin-antitoxin module